MPDSPDEELQKEFNRWAESGRGEEMERHHLSIGEQTIQAMELRPGERVLDLGCGTGWASRLMARLVDGASADRPNIMGQVIGLDISDEMIRHARERSREVENAMFVWGSAHSIPWEENYFDKVLSIEAFYYYHDQPAVLAELMRVMAPRAGLYLLLNLYRENPYSLRWVNELKVAVTVRSAAEYAEMLGQAGFEEVAWRQISDLTPTPETYSGPWFANAEELREYKKIGALLLTARKPDIESPPRAFTVY